jgi:hypothetical protein
MVLFLLVAARERSLKIGSGVRELPDLLAVSLAVLLLKSTLFAWRPVENCSKSFD